MYTILSIILLLFFFNDTATTQIYTLSLHDALPILLSACNAEPQNWRDFRAYIQRVAPDQRDAAVEKFIAAKGGNPVIENQTRLIFFAKEDRKSTRLNSSH